MGGQNIVVGPGKKRENYYIFGDKDSQPLFSELAPFKNVPIHLAMHHPF